MTGDDGFDAYFLRNYGRLVAELHSIVGSVADAEDAVQEAFARASVRWERLRDYDHPDAWVRRVALNLAASSLRRSRRSWSPTAESACHRRRRPLERTRSCSPRRSGGCAGATARSWSCTTWPSCQWRRWRVLRIPVGTVKGRLFRARAALERELGGAFSGEVRHA